MKSTTQSLTHALLIAVLMGCGGGSKEDVNRPARTLVSGTVTLNNTPVEGATVTLHPVQKGNGAFGITDAAGHYKLQTFEKDDGAVPGDYKVSIKKLETKAPVSQPEPDDPNYDPNPKEEPAKNLLPEKYADFNKSGLEVTISNTPKTDLNFDLK